MDVIHANKKEVPRIFRITTSSFLPNNSRMYNDSNNFYFLTSSEIEKQRWLFRLNQMRDACCLTSSYKSNQVFKVRGMLENFHLGQLKNALCSEIINEDSLVIGTEEGMYYLIPRLNHIKKIGKSKRITKIQYLPSEQLLIVMAGKSKQIHLLPVHALDNSKTETTEWIKISQTKNCLNFTAGPISLYAEDVARSYNPNQSLNNHYTCDKTSADQDDDPLPKPTKIFVLCVLFPFSNTAFPTDNTHLPHLINPKNFDHPYTPAPQKNGLNEPPLTPVALLFGLVRTKLCRFVKLGQFKCSPNVSLENHSPGDGDSCISNRNYTPEIKTSFNNVNLRQLIKFFPDPSFSNQTALGNERKMQYSKSLPSNVQLSTTDLDYCSPKNFLFRVANKGDKNTLKRIKFSESLDILDHKYVTFAGTVIDSSEISLRSENQQQTALSKLNESGNNKFALLFDLASVLGQLFSPTTYRVDAIPNHTFLIFPSSSDQQRSPSDKMVSSEFRGDIKMILPVPAVARGQHGEEETPQTRQEYLVVFTDCATYVNAGGMKSRDSDLIYPSLPISFARSDDFEYLLALCENHVNIFRVSSCFWLQTINIKKAKSLNITGTVIMSNYEDPPCFGIMTFSNNGISDETFRVNAESSRKSDKLHSSKYVKNHNASKMMDFKARNKVKLLFKRNQNNFQNGANGVISSCNGDEGGLVCKKLSKLISEPTNFTHVHHMGPGEGIKLQNMLDLQKKASSPSLEKLNNFSPYEPIIPPNSNFSIMSDQSAGKMMALNGSSGKIKVGKLLGDSESNSYSSTSSTNNGNIESPILNKNGANTITSSKSSFSNNEDSQHSYKAKRPTSKFYFDE
ncbi:unnamed protein product [Gordionus sp. m RMFG-2023]